MKGVDVRLDALTPINLEYACMDDWRAKHYQDQAGWFQFATMGRSGRINSVWPLKWEGTTVEGNIEWCANWARRHGIPLVFKLADGCVAPPTLPHTLARLGFTPRTETLVMTRSLEHLSAPEREIVWTPTLTEPFVEVMRAATPSAEDFEERHDVVRRMSNATIFPVAYIDGEPAAIGLGRHSGYVVGLYLMRTAAHARRQGLARDLVRAICAWGRYHAAAAAFLQVEEENAAAIKLYKSEGFALSYRYRYWAKD